MQSIKKMGRYTTMANTTKQYTIQVQLIRLRGDNPVPKSHTGTIEELTQAFSYTLLCGYSWDSRVNRNPKTIKSLVTNLNRAAAAKSTHYQAEYYSLVNCPGSTNRLPN